MRLLLLFIAVPLIEITLFIQVGGLIGLWPTLAIVFGTAVLGTALVRSQGIQALARLQDSMTGAGDPAEALVNGAMILLAGILLLTPGFFTDTVGFLLLIPALRRRVFDWGRRHVQVSGVTFASGGFGPMPGAPGTYRNPERGPGAVIEGEFREIDPDDLPPKPGARPSGWTRS